MVVLLAAEGSALAGFARGLKLKLTLAAAIRISQPYSPGLCLQFRGLCGTRDCRQIGAGYDYDQLEDWVRATLSAALLPDG